MVNAGDGEVEGEPGRQTSSHPSPGARLYPFTSTQRAPGVRVFLASRSHHEHAVSWSTVVSDFDCPPFALGENRTIKLSGSHRTPPDLVW